MTEKSSEMTGRQITQIKTWFEKAVPQPTLTNIHTQLGVHFEEIGEMLTSLQEAGVDFPAREQLAFTTSVIDFIQRRLKSAPGSLEIAIDDIDRTALLDSLCDQIVTAIGVAHMLGMDIEGALQEVADSNDSKFGPDGEPIFNEQRKIIKGSLYWAPNLSQFV